MLVLDRKDFLVSRIDSASITCRDPGETGSSQLILKDFQSRFSDQLDVAKVPTLRISRSTATWL